MKRINPKYHAVNYRTIGWHSGALRQKMERIDPSIIALQLNGKWSILEQIGHLGDLEPLWCGRLDDILNGENVMRAADLGNTLTNDANHISRSWHELVDRFENLRNVLPTSLNNSDDRIRPIATIFTIPKKEFDSN